MVEALVAVLVAVVIIAAVRGWWRGRRSATEDTDADRTDAAQPAPGSTRRSPAPPEGDPPEREVPTAYDKGVDATEEGNRIWADAMADWDAANYDAAADGFGWAETQYTAAAELFERAPTASAAVWDPDDGDDGVDGDDGARRAAQSYEAAARHMRLAAERAAAGEPDRSREHVETAREALAAARAGLSEVDPVDADLAVDDLSG